MEYLLILFVTFTLCGGNENAFPQFEGLGQYQNSLNFVYYPKKIRWSAARAVCESISGDLASIDSDIIRDYIVWKAQENYGYNIFIEEYWVGLVQLNANERFWVADCKTLTLTTHYIQPYDPNKQCMRHKRDHTADHRKCSEVDAFLCQVPSSEPCDVVGVIDSEVLSVGPGITGCDSLCRNDPKCWAAIQYVPNNCVQLAVPGHGVEGFTMKSKFCFNVTLNGTLVADDTTNSSDIPDASCGHFSIQPSSTNVSLVTSLGLPVCDTITLTTNLTIIEMTTETTTKISIKPTTEVSTKTTTEIIHSTTIEISTKTVTASAVTATLTQNITVTAPAATATRTQNITVTASAVTATLTQNITVTASVTATRTQNITVTAPAATATLTQNITVTASVTATLLQNITFEQVEEVAAEIVKNLTIDVKSTSSHKRRLTSAEDKRQSSKFVGYIGIIFVTAPLALMVLTDVRKLFVDFHTYSNFRK